MLVKAKLVGPWQFAGGLVVSGLLSLFAQMTAMASPSVTLSWNQVADPNVTGYHVYYGTTSHSYTSMVDAGNTNSVVISGLKTGQTYYFAATTYDAAGDESAYSAETTYTATAVAAKLSASATPTAGQFSFAVAGDSGTQYVVQASTNLVDWVAVQTNTAPFTFVDTDAGKYSQRFYRTMSLQ